MSPEACEITLNIGDGVFTARLRTDLAPLSCAVLIGMMPLETEVLHARWSGESLWSPLSSLWPAGMILPGENETDTPCPGDVLLFGGEVSEPELLICYGHTRFASVAGSLAGNPVLTIGSRLERLSELGRAALRVGPMRLRIACSRLPIPRVPTPTASQ